MARAPGRSTPARRRRRAPGAKAPPNLPPAPAALAPVTLRLYCHGLGDCLLVSLPTDEPDQPFRILIDCGVHSSTRAGPRRVEAVVADLARACDRRLDVIVGTHEHWDHLSGFLTARDSFVDAEESGLADDDPRIRVGEIWLAWTENPEDPDARALDRYKDEAEATLLGLRLAIEASDDVGGMSLEATATGLDSLFGFIFGARGERVRSAREALRTLLPGARVRYLEPGTVVPLPARVSGFRGYVLGPPRDPRLLRIHDDPTDGYKLAFGNHPETLALASALAIANGHLDLRDDPAAPFDPTDGVGLAGIRDGGVADGQEGLLRFLEAHYLGEDTHRRIDNIWMAGASELALQLDRNTNNTSLVLAFERIETGDVLLFAADAQAGNWRSWQDVEIALGGADAGMRTGPYLLSRTIFYKVGHHGSGNATLRERGLERMDGRRLVAFNPTDADLAGRLGWRNFPAQALTEALEARTSGRYIQSDAGWILSGQPAPFRTGGALAAPPRTGAFKAARVDGQDLMIGWVEIDIA
jgi:hypothetical protein